MSALVSALGIVLGALLGVVPQLSKLGRSLVRRMERHSALWSQLPEGGQARTAIQELIDVEAKKLRDRETRKLGREVNRANVAGVVFFTLAGGASAWGVLLWANAAVRTPWAIVAYIALVLVSALFALIIAAFLTILYAPSSSKRITLTLPTEIGNELKASAEHSGQTAEEHASLLIRLALQAVVQAGNEAETGNGASVVDDED